MTNSFPPGTLVAQSKKDGIFYKELLYIGTHIDGYKNYDAYAYFSIDELWNYLPDWGYEEVEFETLVDDWDSHQLFLYRQEIINAFLALDPDDRHAPLPFHDGNYDMDAPWWYYASVMFYHVDYYKPSKLYVLRLPVDLHLPKPHLPLL